jgi:hypothetical protein
MATAPPLGEDHIATATFRLCKSTTTSTTYNLTVSCSPMQAELDILARLSADGYSYFSTFHHERESCVFGRPLADLLEIWHPEKIEEEIFCLHLHGRQVRLREEDVKAEEECYSETRQREVTLPSRETTGEAKLAPMLSRNLIQRAQVLPKPKKRKVQVDSDATYEANRSAVRKPMVIKKPVFLPRRVTASQPEKQNQLEKKEEPEMKEQLAKQEPSEAQKPRKIKVKLSFDVGSTKLSPEIWRSITFEIPRSTVMTDLPTALLSKVRGVAKADHLFMPRLQRMGCRLGFIPTLCCDDSRKVYCDFEHNKVLLRSIADLFDNETADEVVRLCLRFEGDAQDGPPESAADAVLPLVCPMARPVCLGSVAAAADKDKHISTGKAIIGVFDRDDRLSLGTVPIWIVDKTAIGDWRRGQAIVFNPDDRWLLPYRGARSLDHLTAKVLERRGSAHDQDDPLMPKLPFYTFNHLDPDQHGLGITRWPSDGVHVAVRVVDMLPPESDLYVMLHDVPSIQYELVEGDELDDIISTLKTEMNTWSVQRLALGTIFRDEMAEEWELTMWVLPQIAGETTLYRWFEGPITQFVRPRDGEVDANLYVEAHILKVGGRGQRRR